MRRLSVFGLLLAAGVCVPATQQSQATLASVAVGARLVAVQFSPAAGWHLLTGRVHACPGVRASRCSQVTSVASTTRWRDCLECLPHRTLSAMPGKSIAIQITVAIEHPPRVDPMFSWPLQVKRAKVTAGFEGLPRRIGVYQASTRVDAREVFLFVFFGRDKPTVRQVNRVNAELRRAHLG